MAKYLIKGQNKLKGKIKISGAKNAALPIIAATLLTNKTCRINNVPNILDIRIMLKILEQLGTQVNQDGNSVEIQTKSLDLDNVDKKLFTKLRASILLLGPILSRLGKAKLFYPGGCIIGKRPIDVHLNSIKALGGEVVEDTNGFEATLDEIKLDDNRIYLRVPSVTGTENLMMMIATRETGIKIEQAAREPHIVNLANMLNMMGARISGAGTNRIKIKGAKELKGVEVDIVPDAIETASFAALALATKSPLKLEGVGNKDNLFPILSYLDEINANYNYDEENQLLSFADKQELISANFKTEFWPGFPTDAQPPFTVLATQTKGITLVHETIFEQRLYYIDQLTNMGAKIIPCDPHRVVVNGPTKLHGSKIVSPDIRAGMAMVIAALLAENQSEIDNIELIERGHENLVKKLKGVGADIIKQS